MDNQNNNDAHLADPTLNQSGKLGWRSIGEYDLNGYVNVYLADTDALDNGRRITADAMRVVRLGALSSSNEADTTDEAVDLDGVILTNPAGYDPPVSGQSCTSNRDGRGWPIGQCTAYVMWRLDREGLPRYITDRGNDAQYWDTAIDQVSGNWNSALAANGHSGRVYKNGTPVVGAVAQWEANHHGAGADGHVAYVQEVSNGGKYDPRLADEHQRPVQRPCVANDQPFRPGRFGPRLAEHVHSLRPGSLAGLSGKVAAIVEFDARLACCSEIGGAIQILSAHIGSFGPLGPDDLLLVGSQ